MAAVTAKHFDILDYVKKAKEYGASDEFAEYNARQIEQAIEIAVTTVREDLHIAELATKKDIELAIKSLEVKLMTLYGSGFLILLGVLAKGFHWF